MPVSVTTAVPAGGRGNGLMATARARLSGVSPPARAARSPSPRETTTPQPSPVGEEAEDRIVERHPVGTACAYGEQWRLEPWLFRNFVQWTPDASIVVFTNGPRIFAVSADGSRLWQVGETIAVGRGLGDAEYDFGQYVYGSSVGSIAPFTIAPGGKHVVYATCAHPKPQAQLQRKSAGERLRREDYEFELARARLDGTEYRRLTVNERIDTHPSWSPDGRRIAFLSHDDRYQRQHHSLSTAILHLYTMAPDGSKISRVQNGAVNVHLSPRWSPDGTRVAYVRHDAEFAMWLHAMVVDGGAPRRLAVTVSEPSWSPDGKRLAFAKPDGAEVALYTIAVDGSDAQRVTTIPGKHWHPQYGAPDPSRAWIETVAWSPSGEHILYSCAPAICVVTPEGTPVSQAPLAPTSRMPAPTSREAASSVAAWAPDGSRIAIASPAGQFRALAAMGDAIVLFTMTPDGANLRPLVVRDSDGSPQPVGSRHVGGPVDIAGCAAGTAIPEPAANPGLVQDCETLLGLRGALAGTVKFDWSTALDWSATRPLSKWDGVVVDGSPPRVTELNPRTAQPMGDHSVRARRTHAAAGVESESEHVGGHHPTRTRPVDAAFAVVYLGKLT